MKPYFRLLILLLVSVTSAQALTNNTPVKTQLQLASFDRNAPKQLYIPGKAGKRVAIPVAVSNMAPRQRYRGPQTFFLFENETSTEGEAPLAKLTLPSNSQSAIILLLPPKKESRFKYRAVVIDGSEKNFPKGSRYLINASSTPIRGEWGKMPFVRGGKNNLRFMCKAQKSLVVPALDPQAERLAGFPIILEFQDKENGWSSIAQTRWFHTPQLRHLIVVYRNPSTKNIQFRGLLDTQVAKNKSSNVKSD